eukprot:COSAG06_NODE_847_length_11974_cov_58.239158_4_plen_205_part_00
MFRSAAAETECDGAQDGLIFGHRGPLRPWLLPLAASSCRPQALIDGLGVHPDGRYGFGAPLFLLRLGRQLACGPHLDSDRVSGVIELIAAADFKMNLITIPAEMDSPPHHSGHVHPEPGVGVWSDRSRRHVTSACRRSHLSQPCLHPPLDLPVCLIRPWCGGEAGAGRWWRLVADPGGSGPAADRPTKNRWCTKRGTAAAGGST